MHQLVLTRSPVSLSSHATWCQLGWKSHPIIVIAKAALLPSVFDLQTKVCQAQSSLRSYAITFVFAIELWNSSTSSHVPQQRRDMGYPQLWKYAGAAEDFDSSQSRKEAATLRESIPIILSTLRLPHDPPCVFCYSAARRS